MERPGPVVAIFAGSGNGRVRTRDLAMPGGAEYNSILYVYITYYNDPGPRDTRLCA